MLILRHFLKKTIRVYHTTKVENLQNIFKYGLLKSFQKDRKFEKESLGLDLLKDGVIYLSKDLSYLCIPPKENKRVVLQIDIPESIYRTWDKINRGDPMFQVASDRNKFKSYEDFCYFMMSEMRKQDPRLDYIVKQEIQEYGSLENTPRFKHAMRQGIGMSPEYCLCISENIPPEWINSRVIDYRRWKKLTNLK